MRQYLSLVEDVLMCGTRKQNRTGIDTLSTFNCNYQIDLRDGFPLLTTKAISWKNIVMENLWFLSGERNVELLRRHGCKFWDPWCDEHGNAPDGIYGEAWRSFPATPTWGSQARSVDQVKWILTELRRNPMSRRLVCSAWIPHLAEESRLPPCHLMWVLNVQLDEQGNPMLCLHLTQRSADVALGVPYNIAGYALLLELFARFSGIPAGIFAHSIVDAHIYTCKPDGSMSEYDHELGLRVQLTREPRPLPRLTIAPEITTLEDVEALMWQPTERILEAFRLDGYSPHPAIPFKVAV